MVTQQRLVPGHAAAACRGRGKKEGVRRAEGEGGRVATSPGSREIHLGRPRLEDQGGGEVDRGGGEVDRGGGDGGEVQDQRGPTGMQIRWQSPWSSREKEGWRLG